MNNKERKNWLMWRSKGIGSSDSAIIHDKSPYKNRYELYMEKITPQTFDGEEKAKNDYITFRGQELEPIIRKRWATIAALELGLESEWLPINLGDEKVMRASLDAHDYFHDNIENPDEKMIIAEFKFQGKENHEKIKQKIAPEHYVIQVQHQLLVSGALRAYLVSYNDELDTINYMEILPDVEFHNLHIKKCREFWAEVTSKTPSEHTLSFKKEIVKSENNDFKKDAYLYKSLSEQIKNLEKLQEEIKEKLIAANGTADKTDFEFVTVTKAKRAGGVEYAKIPELKGVDLDKYRKPDTEYFVVKVK